MGEGEPWKTVYFLQYGCGEYVSVVGSKDYHYQKKNYFILYFFRNLFVQYYNLYFLFIFKLPRELEDIRKLMKRQTNTWYQEPNRRTDLKASDEVVVSEGYYQFGLPYAPDLPKLYN